MRRMLSRQMLLKAPRKCQAGGTVGRFKTTQPLGGTSNGHPTRPRRRQFSSEQPSISQGVVVESDARTYTRKTPTEHVLLRPDTYIGGVAMRENQVVWVLDPAKRRMVQTTATFPPGLVHIFDELLVNAADNKARDPRGMTLLRVDVDRENGRISVWNNGRGLPIEVHPTEGVYVPTLVFGSLFTSSNYDDRQVKIVGGRNGYGAKLCNIFSREFIVETRDSSRRRLFRQRWYENMRKCDEPVVADEELSSHATDFTKVTFVPDLARFGLTELSDDVVKLLERRVVDVAATLPIDVRVVLNGRDVEVRGFRDFVETFLRKEVPEEGDVEEARRMSVFRHPSPRWHVAVVRKAYSEHLPAVTSFVNNICTSKGGTHVDYVLDRLVAILKPAIEERLQRENAGISTAVVKPHLIKSNVALFVTCFVENPTFESQTKDLLTTRPKNFGSTFEFDKKQVLEWAERSGFVVDVIEQIRNRKAPSKGVQKLKTSSLSDLVKLEDASWATSSTAAKRRQCTLFVTEGDSAKALALAGLEVIGRERYGVFPLKGKLINVSHLDEAKAKANVEVSSMMRILGLEFGVDYGSEAARNSLRYGRLMILADQDEDGSHIKGLIINLLHRFWPALVRSGDFVTAFRTPLLKAKRGNETLSFYSLAEFRSWQRRVDEATPGVASKFVVKYYKGLGTSTAKEAREYFSNFDQHIVRFDYSGDEDDEAIRMAFDREQTQERRDWIGARRSRDPNDLDQSTNTTFKSFLDDELMQFNLLDLKRSIPSVVDGLKPSQRKVLFTLLQMDTDKEIKVSQLAGAVAHSQAYHHGEESLVNTVVRMAQDFCGANNVALLQPIGQFGTRHENGHDAASARYIFTALSAATRCLFPAADVPLLERLQDDGQLVEPKWLCPIVPLVLVNGAEGIATGWATKIANRSVDDVVGFVRRAIDASSSSSNDVGGLVYDKIEVPTYAGFTGRIEAIAGEAHRFAVFGSARILKADRKNSAIFSIEVTELPVGVPTSKYKEKLNALIRDGLIRSYAEEHTERQVRFVLHVDRTSSLLHSNGQQLLKAIKLASTTTENLVLFGADGQLRRYASASEIACEHFRVRRWMYERRRDEQLRESHARLQFAQNQIRFIESVLNGQLRIEGRRRQELEAQMTQMGFVGDPVKTFRDEEDTSDLSYLLEMPMYKLTSEEVDKLRERGEQRRRRCDEISAADWRQTWTTELDRFARTLGRL